MNRSAVVIGTLLLLIGVTVFLWKIGSLGMPLLPNATEGLWRVELEITARGTGNRGSLRVPLPSSGPGQVVFDERSSSDRLTFTIRTEDGQRIGVWSGRFSGVHRVAHGFRIQVRELQVPLPTGAPQPPASKVVSRYGVSTGEFPADSAEIRSFLESFPLPGSDDPTGCLRMLFAFVSDEVATAETGADDALLTLSAREGTALGKTRLLVTPLRAAALPSRIVLGLRLREEGSPLGALWAETWIDGRWVPVSPVDGFFATRPSRLVTLRSGSGARIDTTGVEAVGHRYHAPRERLRPEELTAMMAPPNLVLARLSLYRLPVATQSAVRSLLLLPLGALVVALFRNVIGLPTYGTFMPVLVAFALRETSLGLGLAMVGAVLLLGVLGRLLLDRLHLLLVPRLSIFLCVVVLSVTGLALIGRGFDTQDFFASVLFPVVILTNLIERFSITIAEEGLRPALVRAGHSMAVAMAVYPIFQSSLAEHLMFGFPELVVSIMGLLIFIGGYTGYRLMDLIRFRSFVRFSEGKTL